MKMNYSFLDRILDKTVFFSFDKSGFHRHRKYFTEEKVNLAGRIILITGANSGLGFEAAQELAKKDAKIYLLCRSAEKGGEAIRIIRNNYGDARLSLVTLDVSDLSQVKKFAETFKEPRIDVLINNAGVLPATRTESVQKIETTLATNLVGPQLLTELLIDRLQKSDDPRVINVSSGGMYAQKLDLKNLQSNQGPFDGVKAYANTKRAQIILTEFLAQKYPNVTFASMHPGWADTPGVATSLPKFSKFMGSRLRTALEGADTIIWLASSPVVKGRTGLFWFDRQPVSAYILKSTKESAEDRETLRRTVYDFFT